MQEMIGPAVGDKLPVFELPDDQNNRRTPQNLMGEKGLLLVFVRGTWCAPCLPVFYTLGKQVPQYERDGVRIAVVSEDDPAALNNFKRTAPTPLDYPILADPDDVAHKIYDLGTARAWFLVDRDGVIREKYIDQDGNHMPKPNLFKQAIQTAL